jgi:hypothetical protein
MDVMPPTILVLRVRQKKKGGFQFFHCLGKIRTKSASVCLTAPKYSHFKKWTYFKREVCPIHAFVLNMSIDLEFLSQQLNSRVDMKSFLLLDWQSLSFPKPSNGVVPICIFVIEADQVEVDIFARFSIMFVKSICFGLFEGKWMLDC